MRSIALSLLICCALASHVAAAKYAPNWASLNSRPIPTWYDDAKFGVFIHWGVYSVPAWAPVGTYAEWYWWDMYNTNTTSAFHNATYGPAFKYTDFADFFRANLFNATQWADIIAQSGARYVVPTSKHHEGFTMWQTNTAWNWNAVDAGPHRDLLGELATAFRDVGLHFGLYYSLFEWYNPFYTGPNPQEYVNEIMLPQMYDVVNKYQPEVFWSDGDWDYNSTFWHSQDFLAWLYNDSPVKDTIVVNDRWGADCPGVNGGFFTPEYTDQVYLNHKWEESNGVDIHSYGYNRNTPASEYYTVDQLVNELVWAISNNGNLLLDIGPYADGTIPPIMQDRLLGIGAWLQVNGEAVYGSRMWRVHQEGLVNETSVRYTMSGPSSSVNNVYAFLLDWPDNNTIALPSPIATANTAVTMLGYARKLTYTITNVSGGISVNLPAFTPTNAPCQYVWVLRLQNVK